MERGIEIFRCPCKKCHGGHRYSVETIKSHHRENGRDEYFVQSIIGGDPAGGFSTEGIWVEADDHFEDARNVFDDAEIQTEYEDNLDPFHDVHQQLLDAFECGDQIREDTLVNHHERQEEDEAVDDISGNLELLEELYRQATKPLYEGANVSLISAIIVLVNMAVIHNVTNAYMSKLLHNLGSVLLPQGNRLPRKHYDAKEVIKKLGLNYNIIDACPNGCVLFRNEHEHLTACPREGCGLSRFIPGSTTILARVIRHFPLIPRLLRMMRSPAIAKLLRWHHDFPNNDEEVMKSVVDSPAWRHVDTNIDPTFSRDPRNLRFSLALDRVNPFKHNSTQHSTWPVLLLMYNLPPFLVTKKFFIQLCILISGKDSSTNENLDVFMRPLVEELQMLWTGILAQDFSNPIRDRSFSLRGMLMWMISDYPGYGLVSRVCTHGFRGCAVCGPETDSRFVKSGNKLNAESKVCGSKEVFGGGRRWLR
jgi:hypothetical protein